MSIIHGDRLEMIVVNDNTVILAGSEFYDEDIGEFQYSREVYSLNMISGEATQLPDMPEEFCRGHWLYFACLNNGALIVMNGENWATLSIDGDWQMNPNLEGTGLKAIHINYSTSKVFAGNSLIDFPFDELYVVSLIT